MRIETYDQRSCGTEFAYRDATILEEFLELAMPAQGRGPIHIWFDLGPMQAGNFPAARWTVAGGRLFAMNENGLELGAFPIDWWDVVGVSPGDRYSVRLERFHAGSHRHLEIEFTGVDNKAFRQALADRLANLAKLEGARQ
jgi:hypothetical protein